jgi:hypothetical protein
VGPDCSVYFTSTHLATKGAYIRFISTQEQFPAVPTFTTIPRNTQGNFFVKYDALLAPSVFRNVKLYVRITLKMPKNQGHLINDSRIFAKICDLQIIYARSGYLKAVTIFEHVIQISEGPR